MLQVDAPSIAVLYGRRRIGKTELIRQATKQKPTLFFEGIENSSKSEQIDAFLFQIEPHLVEQPKNKPVKWREAFQLLTPFLKEKPHVVVLDELQWLANYRSDLIVDLKLIWDQQWSRIPGVKLILCGSIASFMKDKVVKSTALYGRAETIIHLQALNLFETKKLLECNESEALLAQMHVGGIPQYLNLLKQFPSVSMGIAELAFTKEGYLATEYDRIFVSHFGKNRDYEKIIRYLSAHPYGSVRKDIVSGAKTSSGGRLSENLANLEAAGFISSFTPVDKKHTSTTIRYEITDQFLRLYLNFIEPNMKVLDTTNATFFASISTSPAYRSWLGRSFEYVCRQHSSQISKALGFSAVRYIAGPFFRRNTEEMKGVQLDLLYDRADNVLTICEMKYHNVKIGQSVLSELAEKESVLQELFPQKTIQSVVVAANGVTQNLADVLGKTRIVEAPALFVSDV